MAVKHVHSLRGVQNGNGVNIPLACSGYFFATPHLRSSDVGVWSLRDIICKPLDLKGHSKAVTALAFSSDENKTQLLCSAGSDYVILWDIEKARNQFTNGSQVRGLVIGTTLGSVQYIAFSHNNEQVAVCAEKRIVILDTKHEETVAVLEGHTSFVNCAEYCPHSSSTIVSASDDRTFKIWDISEGILIYQSTIVSSSPFISMAMNFVDPVVAIGTTDGIIRVYDLSDGNNFRCLHTFSIEKAIRRELETRGKIGLDASCSNKGPITISSRPSWQLKPHQTEEEDLNEDGVTDAGFAALNLCFISPCPRASLVKPPPPNLPFLHQDHLLLSDLLESPAQLMAVTPAQLIQLNTKTLELNAICNLTDSVPSVSVMEESNISLPLTGNVALSQSSNGNQSAWGALGSIFGGEINILSVDCSPGKQSSPSPVTASTEKSPTASPEAASSARLCEAESLNGTSLSVLSSNPLASDSPLRSELVLKSKGTTSSSAKQPARVSQMPGTISKQGRIVDRQPITFHDKVKSSGYTAGPRRNMFQPKLSSPKTGSNVKQSKTAKPAVLKEYPMDCAAPCKPRSKVDVAERPTAISSVSFSGTVCVACIGDGQNVATAQANTVVQTFKMPLTGKGCAFLGHNSAVFSAQWSHDAAYLISASDDKTAKLWSVSTPDPVLDVTTVDNNMAADKEGGIKPDKKNPLFNKAVNFAQFYYVDKFFILTSGNSFYLYKYHLDLTKSDIKRYLSHNKYKLVRQFQMSESQNITAFSAVNSFHSHLAFCGGSNKSVEIFDVNTCQSVRVMTQVHTRQPHALCLNTSSVYASPPQSAYDLFVTAAASDAIKLWDVRSNRCVRRYEGHCNRSQPCGVAFSPCSRFLATGSEDRSAYIYDLRSSTYLHKLTGHTDTVSGVTFHPLHAQLVTATLDGKIRLFSER